MKRGLYALIFLLSSSIGFGTSVFLQETWIEQRGREQFRDTLVWKERNLEGRSGSNQYVEFLTPISTKDRKEDTTWKGYSFLMGTNSNLEKIRTFIWEAVLDIFVEENEKILMIGKRKQGPMESMQNWLISKTSNWLC
ncbi:hypothetical protein C095_02875 [Fusobacterium necrophorum subsp. funduliforme B35]|uniref:Uncharacterized protein n=1 Tax=Fusobacterium necrophorum subsp. funduliforme B35 TaxID=1226633 RepID=A0A0B4EXS4_9FUSO|nr:hypothetical protein C095_02875 [Fusobacterium necrophorum subsp. funduliforme B35]